MVNNTKTWAIIALAFVSGFGVGHYGSKAKSHHMMAAKQAEWQKGTRERFAAMRGRVGEEGRSGRHEGRPEGRPEGRQGKKGDGKRRKGEGGPQK